MRQILILLALLAGTGVAGAQEVAPSHPVYEFLERCEGRRLLMEPLSSSLPLTRIRISALLDQIEDSESVLTQSEIALLRWYRIQFDDLVDSDSERATRSRHLLYDNRRDLYALTQDDWAIYVNPVVIAREAIYRCARDSLRGELSIWGSGVSLYGRVDRLTFSASLTDQHIRGNTRLSDRAAYPYQYGLQSRGFDFDETNASLSWETRHLELDFGKFRNRWGPGSFEELALSDHPTSYTQLRSRLRLGPFELTSVQAKLQQSPPVVSAVDTTADGALQRQYADKFLAAHRLEWNVNRQIQIGLNESIVYGERVFDVNYLHPLIFLRSAEHYAGDRDNALMGADFKWCMPGGPVLYGQLLIDDITTTKLGTGWFGNKLAWQAGIRAYDPLALPNTRFIIEYSRVEPYVYSHKFPINTYQQYGTLLGASIGSNSDALRASLAWTVNRPLELEVWAMHQRHGSNPQSGRNVGGDFLRPWASGDSKTADFLDGDRVSQMVLGFNCRCEIVRGFYANGELQSNWLVLNPESGANDRISFTMASIGFDWNGW